VSLRHATLASLLDGEASGYELTKRMDVSVANFWHALPTQIYAELRRLEEEGLVAGREVTQERRPNKRVYSVTDEGRRELEAFTRKPPRPTSIKDELLVQIQAADVGDAEAVAAAIDERRGFAEIRLAIFDGMVRDFLRGRDEASYLRTARRIGPYLNLRRGRDFERENVEWYRVAADALRARAAKQERPPPAPPRARPSARA
jgi:DNA-binding PadR family transcriptional regulator